MKKTLTMLAATAFALTAAAPAMAHMTRAQLGKAKQCKAMSHRAMMRNKTCMAMQRKGMMSTDTGPKDEVTSNAMGRPGDGMKARDSGWTDASKRREAPMNSGTMKKH